MPPVTRSSKRARTDDNVSSEDDYSGGRPGLIDPSEDERESREEKLEDFVDIDCSLESPEEDAKQSTTPGDIPAPHDYVRTRGYWVCSEDCRLNGKCENAPCCEHWPLPESASRQIEADQRSFSLDSDSDDEEDGGGGGPEGYWKKRRVREEEEDALKSSSVTFTVPKDSPPVDGVPAPPPPSPTDPVVAIKVHAHGAYSLSPKSIIPNDIVGVTFEYANGSSSEWSHVNARPLHKDPRPRKVLAVTLNSDEHLVRAYMSGFGAKEVGSNNPEWCFVTSEGRFLLFEKGKVNICRANDWRVKMLLSDVAANYACPDGEAIWALGDAEPGPRGNRPAWKCVVGGFVSKPISAFVVKSKLAPTAVPATLSSIAIKAIGEKWKSESDGLTSQHKRDIQSLTEEAKNKLNSRKRGLINGIILSDEADRVLKLRSQLEDAEKRLAAKRDIARVQLAQYEHQVQREFDRARESRIREGCEKRASQVHGHREEMLEMKRHGGGDTENKDTSICTVPECSQVYEPRMVPMTKRCDFRETMKDGSTNVCAGAAYTCGCSTTLCLKCRAPICRDHFAQHKRQCIRRPNETGIYRHCDLAWDRIGKAKKERERLWRDY